MSVSVCAWVILPQSVMSHTHTPSPHAHPRAVPAVVTVNFCNVPLFLTLVGPRLPVCWCLQLPDVTDLDPLEVKLPKIDPDAMDFLKSTLRYEPSARATCDELLAHPFFEGFEEWFAPVCLDAVDFFPFA